MRVSSEFVGNNGGKVFIKLSSGACNRAAVDSLPPYFVNPKYICIRESASSP
jgi:hypothetical protein